MRRLALAVALALAAASCAILGPPDPNDAQQAIVDLKFAGTGTPADLTVTGEAVQRGDKIEISAGTNRPAAIAVFRVARGGETRIVARSTGGRVQTSVPAGKGGIELFEFLAAADATAWPFTRQAVDLGSTTRAIATDLSTTFRGAKKGTVAVAHTLIRVD